MKKLSIFQAVLLSLLMSMGLAACGSDDDDTIVNGSDGKSTTSEETVDLGLSVAWATCNVGANKPEDFGDYFAWGETSPKSSYDKSNSTTSTYSVSSLQNRGIIDSDGNLTATYDAATANWGDEWRMPTYAEIRELMKNCTWTWTTRNGVNGYIVTGPNGNSIFLPAAGYRDGADLYGTGAGGYYWSATTYGDFNGVDYCGAYDLFFIRDYRDWGNYDRTYGRAVRPVQEL